MRRILLATAGLVLMTVTFGAVFKWVDEQGNLHYGDSPPTDRKTEEIKMLPGPDEERVRRATERAEKEREYLGGIDRKGIGKKRSRNIFSAIEAGNVEYVLSLLEGGTNPNVSDAAGRTALMYAGINGQTRALMGTLIKLGAHVNAKSRDGTTALIASVMFGDPKAVKLLLTHGADVNAKDNDGRTALEWAKFRLRYAPSDRGFYPNMRERNQYGDYTLCTKTEFVEVVKLLRDAGGSE